MILHVLKKLAVPGRVSLAAVLPEHEKLRQQAAREGGVDVGHAQDIEHVGARLPVGGYASRLVVETHRGGVARPLAFDVGDETRIPGSGSFPAFGPVQHEFRYRVLDEMQADACALQDLDRVLPGLPVRTDRLREVFADEGLGVALAPSADHVTAEFAVP